MPPAEFVPIIVPGLDDATDCPSCEKPMQPGAILCSHCGFNLKTGEKKVTRAAPAKPASAASAFAGLARPNRPTIVEDKKIAVLKLLAPLLVLLGVVGIGFTGYALIVRTHKTTAPAKGNDAQVLQWMDEQGAKEIHEWFKQDPDRMAGDYNTRQAISKADELQQLGAKQVLAFGPRMTRSLAVELPDNPDQRKVLFDWENKFALEHHYKPDSDVGQHYLLLQLQ